MMAMWRVFLQRSSSFLSVVVKAVLLTIILSYIFSNFLYINLESSR